jgi:hypothetical protein
MSWRRYPILEGSAIDRFGSVRTAYRRTQDVFKVAYHALRDDPRARHGTRFVGNTEQEIKSEITAMQNRLDDAAVVELWVIFERFVIEHVTASVATPNELAAAFRERFGSKMAYEIERWRFDELLDLYKGWLDSDEIGRAKQIKAYRDWVAHRNPRKGPPVDADPEAAYHVLVSIVTQIQADEPGSVPSPS